MHCSQFISICNTSKQHRAVLCITQVVPGACCLLQSNALHRFSGKVEEWDGMSKHLVVYDDGDEEWMDLASNKIKLHAENGE